MKIELKKIKLTYYSDLLNNIKDNISFYSDYNVKELTINNDKVTLDDISEPLSSSEKLEIEINEVDLIFRSMAKWKENASIGKLLHRKLSSYEKKYLGTFYESNFWAYLAHLPIFRKYINERYFVNSFEEDKEDNVGASLVEKIKRYFLFKGTISRTGIMFNWALTDCLHSNVKQYELCDIAFSYIDSVKAIYERSFRKNRLIVQAFVQGIINNGKSTAFKNSEYRSIIPTHISNIAALNMLDSYDSYSELVNKITVEQAHIIALYNEKQ